MHQCLEGIITIATILFHTLQDVLVYWCTLVYPQLNSALRGCPTWWLSRLLFTFPVCFLSWDEQLQKASLQQPLLGLHQRQQQQQFKPEDLIWLTQSTKLPSLCSHPTKTQIFDRNKAFTRMMYLQNKHSVSPKVHKLKLCLISWSVT